MGVVCIELATPVRSRPAELKPSESIFDENSLRCRSLSMHADPFQSFAIPCLMVQSGRNPDLSAGGLLKGLLSVRSWPGHLKSMNAR